RHAGQEATEPALRRVLREAPSLEYRRRVERQVGRLALPGLPPQQLRELRALEALEIAATAEAQTLLRVLAQGAPEARLTKEATAALARLGALNAPAQMK